MNAGVKPSSAKTPLEILWEHIETLEASLQVMKEQVRLLSEVRSEEAALDRTALYQKPIYTQAEFAKVTGISRRTQLALRKAGKLEYCLLPGLRIGYRPEHIDEYLESVTERIAR